MNRYRNDSNQSDQTIVGAESDIVNVDAVDSGIESKSDKQLSNQIHAVCLLCVPKKVIIKTNKNSSFALKSHMDVSCRFGFGCDSQLVSIMCGY